MKNACKKVSFGFTLIEIIVVVTVMAILSIVGLASFSDYNHSQTLGAATLDVYTMLNTAKSRAQSQVKPASCPDAYVLKGYAFAICGGSACALGSGDDDYQLKVICTDTSGADWDYRVDGKKRPTNISFVDTGVIFFFPVIKGGATLPGGGGTITISGYNKNRTITVDSTTGSINTSL